MSLPLRLRLARAFLFMIVTTGMFTVGVALAPWLAGWTASVVFMGMVW